MIPLTNLNHEPLILNCDLIKCIEHDHDTVITLLSGEKLRVEEEPGEILKRISAYRRHELAPIAAACGDKEPPEENEHREDGHG